MYKDIPDRTLIDSFLAKGNSMILKVFTAHSFLGIIQLIPSSPDNKYSILISEGSPKSNVVKVLFVPILEVNIALMNI